jgi:hypothetical protein
MALLFCVSSAEIKRESGLVPDRSRWEPREGAAQCGLKIRFKICFGGPECFLLNGHFLTYYALWRRTARTVLRGDFVAQRAPLIFHDGRIISISPVTAEVHEGAAAASSPAAVLIGSSCHSDGSGVATSTFTFFPPRSVSEIRPLIREK